MAWLNWPNRITIARIVLVVPLVICLLNLHSGWLWMRHLALGLFALMAMSDALDGFLARLLKEETALGRFLDPVADKLLVVSAMVILALKATGVAGFVLPSWVAVIAIGKDLLTVIGFSLMYMTTGQWYIKPRIWGKACTLVQLTLVATILMAPDLPVELQDRVHWLWWLASVLAVIALADYVRFGSRFAAGQHPAGDA